MYNLCIIYYWSDVVLLASIQMICFVAYIVPLDGDMHLRPHRSREATIVSHSGKHADRLHALVERWSCLLFVVLSWLSEPSLRQSVMHVIIM